MQVVVEDELLATVVEDIALLHSKFVSLDLRLGSKVILFSICYYVTQAWACVLFLSLVPDSRLMSCLRSKERLHSMQQGIVSQTQSQCTPPCKLQEPAGWRWKHSCQR